eukprot:20747_1
MTTSNDLTGCINSHNQWLTDFLLSKVRMKVINNIKKCPFKITNEHNAQQIGGIDPSTAKMIKSKLIQRNEYISQNPQQAKLAALQQIQIHYEKQQNAAPDVSRMRKKGGQHGPYVPGKRTGEWALLVHMYDIHRNCGAPTLSKTQLLKDAVKYCDGSNAFTDSSDPMNKLTAAGYVTATNNGTVSLTEAGIHVGGTLFAQMNGEPIPPMPVQSLFDEDLKLIMQQHGGEADNNDDKDVTKPIQIGDERYALYLVYDTDFKTDQNINNKPHPLPIGNFCWTLSNVDKHNSEYVYPIIVETHRMDYLATLIKDKGYIKQKRTIKQQLPHLQHIYLVEHCSVDEKKKKRIATALVNASVHDHILVYHTTSSDESFRCVEKWTHIIHKQISNHHNWTIEGKCLSFEKFTALIAEKKNVNIPAKIIFGRQLMAINGVTDIIASKIVLKYSTMRNLYIAYENCDTEQDEKLLLYNEVNGTCLEWHRDLDSGMIELDEDLRNVCAAMDNTKFKPISKNLSEKIWNAFYCDVQ